MRLLVLTYIFNIQNWNCRFQKYYFECRQKRSSSVGNSFNMYLPDPLGLLNPTNYYQYQYKRIILSPFKSTFLLSVMLETQFSSFTVFIKFPVNRIEYSCTFPPLFNLEDFPWNYVDYICEELCFQEQERFIRTFQNLNTFTTPLQKASLFQFEILPSMFSYVNQSEIKQPASLFLNLNSPIAASNFSDMFVACICHPRTTESLTKLSCYSTIGLSRIPKFSKPVMSNVGQISFNS